MPADKGILLTNNQNGPKIGQKFGMKVFVRTFQTNEIA